jgi:uncharacterized zinc-type alcohol dehydrogenase-like protein
MKTSTIKAFGTQAAENDLELLTIERRKSSQKTSKLISITVVFAILIYTARNDWGGTVYPAVPGHEIVGKVLQVGSEVTKFKIGDLVAVGCMVDSCRTCHSCEQDLEQFCEKGFTGTYNGKDKYFEETRTFGGYSESV